MTTVDPNRRRPPGRYDEPRASSRFLVIIAAVAVAAAVGAAVYGLYARHNAGRLPYEVRGYHVLSDTAVRVTFEVRLDARETGECKVRARGRDGLETGSAVVPVGPGTGGVLVTTYELTTASRASTGEVVGCRSVEQP